MTPAEILEQLEHTVSGLEQAVQQFSTAVQKSIDDEDKAEKPEAAKTAKPEKLASSAQK